MIYNQFESHQSLSHYIDAYWVATGDSAGLKREKILPDGCIDIILNLGEDCPTTDNDLFFESGKAYLVGTMTRFKESFMQTGTKLLGIRFKPAAFNVFYDYPSLYKLADQTVAFEEKFSPDIESTAKYFTAYLDHFFLKNLSTPKRSIFPIVNDIQNLNGRLSVGALAQKHFTTVRQLERSFDSQMGISPKEYINLVRYQYTLQKIRNNTDNKSFLEIAFECGYYDHSHLTNEIKRYTGVAPALL